MTTPTFGPRYTKTQRVIMLASNLEGEAGLGQPAWASSFGERLAEATKANSGKPVSVNTLSAQLGIAASARALSDWMWSLRRRLERAMRKALRDRAAHEASRVRIKAERLARRQRKLLPGLSRAPLHVERAA